MPSNKDLKFGGFDRGEAVVAADQWTGWTNWTAQGMLGYLRRLRGARQARPAVTTALLMAVADVLW